ncbi:MAG: TldD/PmbA family protein, partial [Cyanobacteria bacterium]|nr:TldD/PmbA family protein [Cyanobacteriota bacterium]MDW8202064.1 TldD/PmbA family protein [Cyanobacteriota bacterium SKYGB_h_bin112]
MATELADVSNLLSDLITRYRHRVDYLAIRLEESQGTNILLRGDRVETLSEDFSIGGQVRACYKGGWGFSSFSRLASLKTHVEEAIAAARLVGDDETILASIPVIQDTCTIPLTGTDPRQIPIQQKKQLCDYYADILHSLDARIATTSVRYGDSTQRVILATSEGTMLEQSWVDMEMRFAATARNGDTVQTGRETVGSRRAYEDLLGLDNQVRSAAQRAVDALSLQPVKGNIYTVVIDPILSGLFVHEAFGHLSEADMAYENPDLLEVMELGRRFGPEFLQIY